MAFKPIQFNYIPPATVPTPVPVSTASSSSSGAIKQPINALAAIQALSDLVDTSNYLQALIVDKYKNTGVSIDPIADPATAKALANCYNGVVPPVITTGMYNNLLDCQLALQNINQVVGKDSSIEADPFMLADVTQINNAVASSLLLDGGSSQLAVQSLAVLKGDSLIMQAIGSSLSVYQPGTDLSPTVNSNLNTLISNETSLLNSLNSLQTDVNVISSDINNVLNAYFYQPLNDIIRITSAIKLLKTLNFKKEAKKIFDGLTTVVYIRLLSEAASIYFAADQIAQRVLNPLKSMTGTMGSILNTVNNTVKSTETAYNLAKTTATNVSKSGISGFPNCNPCSQQVLKGVSGSKLPNVPGFNGLSKGLQFLGQHISAAQEAIGSQFDEIESTFVALQKRRNKDFADVLQLMCAMQSAEQLINVGNSVIKQNSVNGIPVLQTQATSTSSLTTILNNLNASSTTSTSTVPIPSNVKSVLSPSLTAGVINV